MMKGKANSIAAIISDKEIEHSFTINELEHKNHNEASFFRATYNRIFLLVDAAGTLAIDDRQFAVNGKEIFLIAKGQVFSLSGIQHRKGYEIQFGDCFWERSPASANNCKAVLFNNVSENQHIPLSEKDLTAINFLLNTLYTEFLSDAYLNKLDALAAYLKIIMIKIANINALLTDAFDSYEKQLYRRFKDALSKQYSDVHEVASYAVQLGVTARKLTDLCKAVNGKGAKEMIDEHILSEAKRALQFSSNPIKEIAYNLSFSSPERFSHFFKRMTQV